MQKNGPKTKEEDFKSMGAFEIGERNKRGTQTDHSKYTVSEPPKIHTGIRSHPMGKQETK